MSFIEHKIYKNEHSNNNTDQQQAAHTHMHRTHLQGNNGREQERNGGLRNGTRYNNEINAEHILEHYVYVPYIYALIYGMQEHPLCTLSGENNFIIEQELFSNTSLFNI